LHSTTATPACRTDSLRGFGPLPSLDPGKLAAPEGVAILAGNRVPKRGEPTTGEPVWRETPLPGAVISGPPVTLQSTHEAALDVVGLADLKRRALELS